MKVTSRLRSAVLTLACVLGMSMTVWAQTTTITASNLKMSGYSVTVGTVTFIGTDVNNIAIPFVDGSGAQDGSEPFSCQIVNGAITAAVSQAGVIGGTCTVPDSADTIPANILYTVQVCDQSNGLSTSGKCYTMRGVTGVTGSSWALDHYGPPATTTSLANLEASQGPVTPDSCVAPSSFTNTNTEAFYICLDGTYLEVASASTSSAPGVSALSVATANGFTGTVSSGTSPVITVNTDSSHILPVNTGSASMYLNGAGQYGTPAQTAAEAAFTGDVTKPAGSFATTVTQIEGAAVPASAGVLGSNSGKQLVAATSVQVSASLGYFNYGSVNTFGDSITQGTGSLNFMAQAVSATGYAEDLIADFGDQGQDYGYGGDQAADMSLKVYQNAHPSVSGNPITTMLISTNDVNVYGTNANQQNIFLRALTASIGWAALPDVSKAMAANTALCTQTGTWANDGAKIYSVTSGSTLSCTVTVPTGSTAIYYGYQAADGYTGGTALITIDGAKPVNDATVYSYGQGGALIATSNGSTSSYFAARYTVAPGTHTFLITTSGGGVVEPVWVGSPYPDAVGTVAPPIVFVGGTPWNEGNTPATTTAAYNTIISNLVASMAADGTPVYFVDIRNGVNTRNSNTATPLNSTTDYAGGQKGTVTCPATAFPPYHPNSSQPGSRACGHGHLAANFEAAIGIKAGGPTATQFVAASLYPSTVALSNSNTPSTAANVVSLN